MWKGRGNKQIVEDHTDKEGELRKTSQFHIES